MKNVWVCGDSAEPFCLYFGGQETVFLNGGATYQLNPAFSFFVRCDSQKEIDNYWDKRIEGELGIAAAGLLLGFFLIRRKSSPPEDLPA